MFYVSTLKISLCLNLWSILNLFCVRHVLGRNLNFFYISTKLSENPSLNNPSSPDSFEILYHFYQITFLYVLDQIQDFVISLLLAYFSNA